MSNDAYTPAAGVHRPTRSRNENTTTHPHVSQTTRAHHDVLVQSPASGLGASSSTTLQYTLTWPYLQQQQQPDLSAEAEDEID